jgi:hypothetical protein
MGLLVLNEDDHKLYELTLISAYVENKVLVNGECQECEATIGLIGYERTDNGDSDTAFIPHFETLAIEYRDAEDALNRDFTGYSCVNCGLGQLQAGRVYIEDITSFVGALHALGEKESG